MSPRTELEATHNHLADAEIEVSRLRAEVERLGKMADALLAHCSNAECGECAKIVCPHKDALHFHHDGCPSCAMFGEEVIDQ